MRVFAAIVALCAALILLGPPVMAHARLSPYPVTSFDGDKYSARQAQMGADVARAVQAKRHRAGRHLGPKRGPNGGQRIRQVPIFTPIAEPGAVEPLAATPSLGEGLRRVAAQIIGGRPQGCPHRFCGCALALRIFGRIVPALNLAVNWVHKFQRSPPAPGMVAARHGHAFQLIAHVRGTTWQVWDANSGRGRTRIHDRSIAGFIIVNPRSNS